MTPSLASVWWAAGLAAASTVGLAVLAGSLLLMDVMVVGVARVLGSDIGSAGADRYWLALLVGTVVNFAGVFVVLALLPVSWERHAARSGCVAAGLAGACGASALLLTLGISPLAFVTAF